MNYSRRDFMALAAATTATASFGETKHFDAFERVPLGKCGVLATRLSFGTGVRSNYRQSGLSRMGHDKAIRLLRDAYELGVRSFDCSDTYGTHKFVAEALEGVPRDSYTLMTKISWRGDGIPEAERGPVEKQIERFLKELKTDYIDVVQLHCVDNPTWPKDLATEMEGLAQAKKAGKIRAHGISIHEFSALHASPNVEWLDVVHVRINPFGKCMAGPVERNMQEIHKLHANGKGIVGMKILGEGSLSNDPEKIDASISFALKSGVIDILNIGFLSIDEVKDIVARIAKVSR